MLKTTWGILRCTQNFERKMYGESTPGTLWVICPKLEGWTHLGGTLLGLPQHLGRLGRGIFRSGGGGDGGGGGGHAHLPDTRRGFIVLIHTRVMRRIQKFSDRHFSKKNRLERRQTYSWRAVDRCVA